MCVCVLTRVVQTITANMETCNPVIRKRSPDICETLDAGLESQPVSGVLSFCADRKTERQTDTQTDEKSSTSAKWQR